MPFISHEIEGEKKAPWQERVRLWFLHFKFPTVTWSLWARLITVAACYLLLFGSFSSFFWGSRGVAIGIYSLVLGILIFPFVWPVKRLKVALIVFQQFLWVGFGLLLLSIPCFFSTPTKIAGFVMLLAGIFYIIGHFQKEKSITLEELRKGAWERM